MSGTRVIPGVTERRIKTVDVKKYGVQGYDTDNKYPQRIKNTLAASGTGTACTKLFAKHLKGRGFSDNTVNEMVVNSAGQKLADIHRLISFDYAAYRGFALHIGYNGLLEIISIKHVPFEFVRLNLPDDLENVDGAMIYDDWGMDSGRKMDPKRFKSVDLYTTDLEKINNQIEKAGDFTAWSGHLYYYSEDGGLTYPKAPCDSVLEDVITDSKVKIYKWRNTENGFMPTHVVIKRGGFESNDAAEEFTENINAFQGADNSHKILVVESDNEATDLVIKPFEAPTKDREFEYTENSVRENIIRAYGQPLVLHAIKTPGSLGMSTEWEDAKKNYDERTEEERERIESALSDIIIQMNPSITREQTIVVPITGIKDKAERAVLANQLGVGGTQALQSVLSDANIPAPQKKNMLIIVFGVTPEDADALVNGTEITQAS